MLTALQVGGVGMSSSTFVDNAEYRKVSMLSMLGMLSKRQRMR